MPTALPGVVVVSAASHADDRGSFSRYFCRRELAVLMGNRDIVQINHSYTARPGTVRGLHFQRPPHAEMKMVRCLAGRVFDVAVDLRAGSPTFLHWHAEVLTPTNAHMLIVPEGCAHGFQALEAGSELLYLHTACHEPGAEGGVRFDDPRLAIVWPLPVADISQRDQKWPDLPPDFSGISA